MERWMQQIDSKCDRFYTYMWGTDQIDAGNQCQTFRIKNKNFQKIVRPAQRGLSKKDEIGTRTKYGEKLKW